MQKSRKAAATAAVLLGVGALAGVVGAPTQQQVPPSKSSYQFPVAEEPFPQLSARVTAAKAGVNARQLALLNSRYDLSDRPAAGVRMSRGKAIQEGVRVRLPAG